MENKTPRYIDTNEIIRIYKRWTEQLQSPEDAGALEGVQSCLDVLMEQPIVDAVEVVRCKDCKSWKCLREDRGLCKHPTFTLEDDTIDPVTEPDDFCSYGERRTDND